jgi:hypothetical protein
MRSRNANRTERAMEAAREIESSDYPRTSSRRRGSGGSRPRKTLGERERGRKKAPRRGLGFSGGCKLGKGLSLGAFLKGGWHVWTVRFVSEDLNRSLWCSVHTVLRLFQDF